MDIVSILRLAWPIIAIQLALQIYAIFDIIRRKKTKNLSTGLWVVIIILGEILGPVLYFLVGKAED